MSKETKEAAAATDINFRWLDGDDLKTLAPIIEERGWMPLNLNTSRALCAFDNRTGHLVGFVALQLVPHTEPLWVSKMYRGTGLAENLADRIVEFLRATNARGFMVVADDPASVRLCEAVGMKRVESPVYVSIG